MILVSVGTQLPFDRLIRAVDRWSAERRRDDVVAQIGLGEYRPVAMRHFGHIRYDHFRDLQRVCDVMVGHAGMGSIIAAMEFGKPIIVMPRDHRLGEHRNGHQFATLREFGDRPGIYPAQDEDELFALLDRADTLVAYPTLSTSASEPFARKLSELLAVPQPVPMVRRLRHLIRGRRRDS